MATVALEEVHVDDIGTEFEVTFTEKGIVVDISTASEITIRFERADQTKITRTMTIKTTGLDGKARYVTVAGDLNSDGSWKFQTHLVMPSGSWYGKIQKFRVYPNL
jgi:hypothetical protein